MDNEGQLGEHLKDREKHGKQSSLEPYSDNGQMMETSKHEHGRYRCHSSGLDEPIFPNSSMSTTDSDKKVSATTFPLQVPWPNTNEARQGGWSLGLETMETSKREHRRYRCHSSGSSGLDEPIFPNSSMSMTDSDKKVSATTFPQQVPWPNTNEVRQDGRSLDDMEEMGLKDPNVVSASVQDYSALPVGNGASDLSTEVRHNDECANGTTNATRQSPQMDNGHENTVQSTSGDRRMVSSSRGSDVAPGAAALGSQGRRCPGISEESRSQEHHPGAFAVPGIDGDRGDEEQVTVVTDEESIIPISAQAVDMEQESRILQENFRLRQMVDNAVTAQVVITNMELSENNGRKCGPGGRRWIAVGAIFVIVVVIAMVLAIVLQPGPMPETKMPTPYQPFEYFNCENAFPLSVSGMTEGTNMNGTVLNTEAACGTGYNDTAVWYRFLGTGRPVTVSTCNEKTNFDTVLAIFNSTDVSCDEGKLNCIDTDLGDTWQNVCNDTGLGSKIIMDSVDKMVYYVSVIGYKGEVGNFTLTLSHNSTLPDTQPPTPTQEPTQPSTLTPTQEATQPSTPASTPGQGANGISCENAELLTVDGIVTAESNVNGSYVLSCDGASYGRGAWYKFIGTGGRLTVSTCNANTTDFATVLSVLSSTDGTCGDDQLICMGTATASTNEYFSGCGTSDTGSTVWVDTWAGTTYYASVIGVADTVGDFGLMIFDDSVGCEEDKAAHPVDGTVTAESNVDGSYVLSCDVTYYGRGTWYKFIGTGGWLTVSTCNAYTADFATVLSVLSSTDGTCGNDKLTCIGAASGNDSASLSGCSTPDTGSTVLIETVAGTTYYASVIGVTDTVGDFGLMIFDDSVGCEEDKAAHPVDGVVTVGSNMNGSYVLSCDDGYYGRGTWYKFIGTGRRLTVSTCNANTTDFATVLSVLSSTDGTCGDDQLTCVDTASGSTLAYYSGCATPDTGSVVSIDSVANAAYYASVIGYGGAVGNFGLSIFDDIAGGRRTLRRMPWPPLL